MRRPRAGDERSSQALGRRRGSAWWPIRAACQELADGQPWAFPRLPESPELTATHKGRCDGSLGSGNPRSSADRKARPGAGIPFPTCGRNGRRRPQMSPGIERCSGGAPGGASAFPQGDADTQRRRQRHLARHPLASGGEKEGGPARGLDKEYGRWRLSWREPGKPGAALLGWAV